MTPPKTLLELVRRTVGSRVSALQILAKMPEAQRNTWLEAHPHDAARLHKALEKRERKAARG